MIQAAGLGDKLIVGLNSDASVKRLKGANRPLIDEESRAQMLAALEMVDAVILFDEDTPYSLIEAIRPDILAKGNDYAISEIAGADLVQSYGGTVKLLPLTKGFSSSSLIEKIKNS